MVTVYSDQKKDIDSIKAQASDIVNILGTAQT